MLISNALGSAATLYLQNEKGFVQSPFPSEEITNGKELGQIELADINQDGQLDILLPSGGNEKPENDSMYESGILLSNSNNSYSYELLPQSKGSTKNIISFDYDLDGDLDLLICNRHIPQKYPAHAPSQLLENRKGKFVDVTETKFPELVEFGIINDVEQTDFNKDGRIDLIILGEWSQIGFFENSKKGFIDVAEKYGLQGMHGLWFSVASGDINQDGQDDYILGNIGRNTKYHASEDKPLKIYSGDFDDNGTWDLVLSKAYKNEYVPFRGLECSSEQMPFIKQKFKTYDLFAKASLEDIYGPGLDEAYHRYVNTMSSYALLSNKRNGFDIVELPSEAQAFPILDIEMIDLNKDGKIENYSSRKYL